MELEWEWELELEWEWELELEWEWELELEWEWRGDGDGVGASRVTGERKRQSGRAGGRGRGGAAR